MPAKDYHHDIVLNALIKAGWTILKEQEYLSIGTSSETHRRLYIDIKAQSEIGQVVLIEVKALDRSPVHQLMILLGQYLVYRAALDYLGIDMPLYVALPETDYQAMVQHDLGREIMRTYAIPFVIYDPQREVIREWIPAL